MHLSDLSDDALLSGLQALCGTGRRLLAQIVVYLGEVEERRIDLKAGSSSLYDFCVGRLGMSEGEAYRRIAAARLVRRFPVLLEHIASGAILLSSLVLLRDHLTEANHEELFAAAAGKGKRAVQELIAARFPRPDVPSSIRKLPRPASTGATGPSPGAPPIATGPSPGAPPIATGPSPGASPIATGPSPDASPIATASPAGTPGSMIGSCPRATSIDDTQLAFGASHSPRPSALPLLSSPRSAAAGPSAMGSDSRAGGAVAALPLPTPSSGTLPKPRRPAALIEPLSETRYKVQFTASTALREKLGRATDLMRHQNPSGDLAVIVERALGLLIAQLEKDRLGKTSHPAKTARPAKPDHVTRAARRETFERDGEQCSYVGEGGNRCTARGFLEVDHVHPRALGGSSEAPNLQIMCRRHNGLRAEQSFGRDHIARQVHMRQRRSNAPAQNVRAATGLAKRTASPHTTSADRTSAGTTSADRTSFDTTTPATTTPAAPTGRRPRIGGMETAITHDVLSLGTRALVRMGFQEGAARRAIVLVSGRQKSDAAPPVESLLREALAVLT